MNENLEEALIEMLSVQRQRYQQAAGLAHSLIGTIESDEDPTPVLGAMQQMMDQMAQADQQLGPLRQAWQQQRRTPGPRLQQLLTSLESTLAPLIQQLATAEHKALEARQRLQPELEEATRRGQMRRAYQAMM